MAGVVRTLGAGDEAALEAYLRPRADSSMFLRANARAAGLADRGERLQATYAAAFDGDAIVGVAAHAWNGIVLLQAPDEHLGDVVRTAVAASGRAVNGLSGPWAQVVAARVALGLAAAPTQFDSRDDLFALALERLRVPAPLEDGRWVGRTQRDDDLELLARWRAAYLVETLGAPPGPDTDEEARRQAAVGGWWLVDVEGEPCAITTFNAQLPDVVQVGGVYTPPERRGRGYARAAVAASLLDARARGAARAILFTGAGNEPARRAYLALGFEIVGDYGLVLLARPGAV